VQTIGWNSTFGGMGVFDPLSENPVVQRPGGVIIPE
jgi:hypothetical protein